VIDATGPIARRFPLVARSRPACLPLDQRVTELGERAREVEKTGDPTAACAVHNLAALLASDVDMPDLARQWCKAQVEAHLHVLPGSVQDVCNALEPMTNLARLHIRAGDGQSAFHLMDSLYTAVSDRTDTVIDGIPIPGARLTTTDEEHREIRRWLWATMLATSARALAQTGQWEHAAEQLRLHRGIGERMFDGRQVAVLAAATTGDMNGALQLLEQTATGEPREYAVTAALTLAVLAAQDQPVAQALSTALAARRALAPRRGLTVFDTRLGLTILDSTREQRDTAEQLMAELAHQALAVPDGYAARDLLADHAHLIEPATRDQLTDIVTSCALARGSLTQQQRLDLDDALDRTRALLVRAPAGPQHPEQVRP